MKACPSSRTAPAPVLALASIALGLAACSPHTELVGSGNVITKSHPSTGGSNRGKKSPKETLW